MIEDVTSAGCAGGQYSNPGVGLMTQSQISESYQRFIDEMSKRAFPDASSGDSAAA